jgi:hypothetical protein
MLVLTTYPKNQVMNMCGFGSTTDLGKMDFNVSCKNYSSKIYTSFAKVVGLVTRGTAKLVFTFLGVFYDFI